MQPLTLAYDTGILVVATVVSTNDILPQEALYERAVILWRTPSIVQVDGTGTRSIVGSSQCNSIWETGERGEKGGRGCYIVGIYAELNWSEWQNLS